MLIISSIRACCGVSASTHVSFFSFGKVGSEEKEESESAEEEKKKKKKKRPTHDWSVF